MGRRSAAGFRREVLRSARAAAGLTREDLAVAAGCSTTSVRNWENGAAVPHGHFLQILADVLELELGDLVGAGEAPPVLSDLRERAGLLQSDAAQALGIAIPTLGELERGIRDLTPERIAVLARLYGISAEATAAAARRTRQARRDAVAERLRKKADQRR